MGNDWKMKNGPLPPPSIHSTPASAPLSRVLQVRPGPMNFQPKAAEDSGSGPGRRHQLLPATVRSNGMTGAAFKQFMYGYDKAGNQTSDQIDLGIPGGAVAGAAGGLAGGLTREMLGPCKGANSVA